MRGAKGKNSFVVDSSFILSYLLPDEKSEAVTNFFVRPEAWDLNLFSVEILPFEVMNGLKTAVLRKRITRKQALHLSRAFFEIPIELTKVDLRECLNLAFAGNLTIYDAAYLQVSKARKFKLLSLDSHLKPFSLQA